MPRTSGRLVEGKPLIEVAVARVAPATAVVAPILSPPTHLVRHYRALLDTGADITCLCDHVVRECSLEQHGFIMMTGGAGSNRHTSHIVHLGIWCEDETDFEGQAEVTRTLFQLPEPIEAAAIRDNRWFDVIIGTDLISQHEFRLTKGGGFVFDLS